MRTSAPSGDDGLVWATVSDLVLDDGRRVAVRPIRPEDYDALRSMHRRLSAETVYRRFFTALPDLAAAQAERFVTVDGEDRAAIVGEDSGHGLVAVARYDRLPGTASAEVAVVVEDAYQHHRLGTELLRALVVHARAHGIAEFVADVLPTNRPMFAALRDAGLTGAADYDAGVAHLVMPLPA